MVNAVSGKPVDLPHLDAEHRLRRRADVLEGRIVAIPKFGRHDADQPLHAGAADGQRERQAPIPNPHEHVGLYNPRDSHIGHIEKLLVVVSRVLLVYGYTWGQVGVVMLQEKQQAILVHLLGLAERKRLAHKPSQPLPQRVIETLKALLG